MSLDVLLEPVPVRAKVRVCKVGRFYNDLPEKYQTALHGLLFTKYEDGGLTDEEMTIRLREAGCDVGSTVVNKHRKNKCACI